MNKLLLLLLMSGLLLAGCSSADEQADLSGLSVKRQEGGSFAHEHRVSIDVPADKVAEAVQAVIDACSEAAENNCTLLASNVSAGDYSRGDVRVRVAPPRVDPLIAVASTYGSVQSLSTTVEDLAEVLADYQTRLDMLLVYREKLQALESSSGSDIDALIKIAQEFTRVQAEIESITGEQAYQVRRTLTDIVEISFSSFGYTSFWQPIAFSLSGFGEDLSEGIASVITGAAYVIPWLLFLFPFFYFARQFWRRKSGKNA